MLHTLRQLIEDDNQWRSILRGLNRDFYHQTVTTQQIEDYLSKKTGKDLSAFFNQYLRTTLIPKLEYKIREKSLTFRYTDVVTNFDMPVRVLLDEQEHWLFPNEDWKTEEMDKPITNFKVDRNFYIRSKRVD